MNSRAQLLHQWLQQDCNLKDCNLIMLPHDASFRRYYRVQHADKSFVAMDAPPEREKCLPFITITQSLRKLGLQTPEVIADNISQGFLLLTDFGDRLYLRELNANNAEQLYTNALNALAIAQTCHKTSGLELPNFSFEFMYEEFQIFQQWFLEKYLRLNLTASTQKMLLNYYDFLAKHCAQQPYVFMHRDYQSANLMLLPNNEVGILDFQDAFVGPVTYDIVSLLRDCYIDWPEKLVQKLVLAYRDKLNLKVQDDEFLYQFDLMGLQRHMKCLLTFSRKFCRDQNANYLQFIPRTLNYILQTSNKYSELNTLHQFFQELSACAQ